MLFLPRVGHDLMSPDQPFDPSATQMLGAALLGLAGGFFIGTYRPDTNLGLIQTAIFALIVIFLTALFSLVTGRMGSSLGTWQSLALAGIAAALLIISYPRKASS